MAIKPVVYFQNLSKFTLRDSRRSYSKNRIAAEPLVMKIGQFEYLTKPKGMESDMIKDVIFNYYKSQYLDSGFLIRTWGRPFQESECSLEKCFSVVIELEIQGKLYFKHQDHSK